VSFCPQAPVEREPITQSQEVSDTELMRRLAAGQINALAELVQRHQDTVRAVAYRMSSRWDVADDVAQDTFLRIHRSAAGYRPTAAFRTWMYRIVVNLCLDRARALRPGPLPPQPLVARGDAPDEPLQQAERVAAVQRAVAALPERQRIVLILHRFEQQSQRQIVQATGWSASAVESLLTRAYQQLREKLEEWRPT
jgi:RNA polymerase sigma-70 factor, ECF subfamily